MTQALHAEFLDSPVGFSVICPGFVRDAGMYARMESEGAKASWVVGTTTPEKVARAVVKAIVHNKPEIIVNSPPLRPVIVFDTLFPSLHGGIMKVFGVTKTFSQTAKLRDLG